MLRTITALFVAATYLGVPDLAQAEPISLEPTSFQQGRRSLTISVQGVTELPNGARLLLRLGEPVFLKAELTVDDGRFAHRFSIRKLLIPGQYPLRVSLAKEQPEALRAQLTRLGAPESHQITRFGAPAAAAKARRRMAVWIKRADEAVLGMALNIERRAHWHRLAMAAAKAKFKILAGHQRAFEAFVNESVIPGLRVARMDFGTYRRRNLVEPNPKARAALAALFALLGERLSLHRQAIDALASGTSAGPPPDLKPFLEVQSRLAAALGPAEKLPKPELGPGAVPENGEIKDGVYSSAILHFRITVPPGWELSNPPFNPALRILMRAPADPEKPKSPRALAAVSLQEPISGALLNMTGVSGWESWQGYQRQALKSEGKRGVWHQFRAQRRSTGRPLLVVEHRILRRDGRILTLSLQTPIGARPGPLEPALAKIARSLASDD